MFLTRATAGRSGLSSGTAGSLLLEEIPVLWRPGQSHSHSARGTASGIITALLGVPFFLSLLRSKAKEMPYEGCQASLKDC